MCQVPLAGTNYVVGMDGGGNYHTIEARAKMAGSSYKGS